MDSNSLTPWISVIMAAYNAESSIHEAIQSILNQTYKQFEFIIVDDGSTDKTYEIISSFPDPRIICIRNEVNEGLTRSLNTGINFAMHDLIVRMDADDTSDLHRFETLVQELSTVPDASVICSRAWISHENNVLTLSKKLDSPEEIYVLLQFKNCLMHSSVMMNRKMLEKYGTYDESFRFAQDYELWNRLSKNAVIHQIHTPLITWRAPGINDICLKNERWAMAEQTIFQQSCAFFLGFWFHYVPKRWINTIKTIIGPSHNGFYTVPFRDLLMSRILLWILLQKVYIKTPPKLNRVKVKQSTKEIMTLFHEQWLMRLKDTFVQRKFIFLCILN